MVRTVLKVVAVLSLVLVAAGCYVGPVCYDPFPPPCPPRYRPPVVVYNPCPPPPPPYYCRGW